MMRRLADQLSLQIPTRLLAPCVVRPAAAAPVNTIKPTGAPPASLIDRSPSGLGVTQYGEI